MSLASAPLPIPSELERALRETYASTPSATSRAPVEGEARAPNARAYHSFAHVEEVLEHWRSAAGGPGFRQPRETYVAALFHDAAYVPGAKDNEAKSAELATRAIARHRLGVDSLRVSALILLTAKHGSLSRDALDEDERLFLDCDMAILGAPPARFDRYEAQIAEEYRAVPRDLFVAGRRAFLTRLAESPRIFLSDAFHARLDGQARANLARALNR